MTAVLDDQPASSRPARPWEMLELVVTGRCQETCRHCYQQSGPTASHGTMTTAAWTGVIDQALDTGFAAVQFIGGEPTLRPDLPELIDHALHRGLRVEVFTNLVAVSHASWDLFSRGDVSLATSYYSDDPDRHDAVTGLPGSHAKTRANIRRALALGIPLRAGVIDLGDARRAAQARDDLHALGVEHVRVDRVRRVGRAALSIPTVSELCGRCGQGRAAVGDDGGVSMCVLSQWRTLGSVREQPLAGILHSEHWNTSVAEVLAHARRAGACSPDSDGSDCRPADTPACSPAFGRA